MGNDLLYAPWRLNYILSEKENTCIFCLAQDQKSDEKHLIVYRSTLCFVIMNMYPYNNGHLMVVPQRHIKELSELRQEELGDLFSTVALSERVIKKVYRPEGLNVGINLGKAAGAGVESHLHVHILPRWLGDANFMTTVGATRVIPESFERAYTVLKEQFDNEAKEK